MQYEGTGEVHLNTGDLLIQQREVRHREVLMSEDYETFVVDFPAAYPTTVLVHNKERDIYKPMFTSAKRVQSQWLDGSRSRLPLQ